MKKFKNLNYFFDTSSSNKLNFSFIKNNLIKRTRELVAEVNYKFSYFFHLRVRSKILYLNFYAF